MTTNAELFRKMTAFSRELRMKGVHAAVAKSGENEEIPGLLMMREMRDRRMEEMENGEMPPMPPHGPHGKGPHGGEPIEGRGHHGRGPHGKGPHGPRRGMSREHLLVIIGDHPEGIWQKEIAEEAGINASSTSEVITKLEEDGFLTRETDENDKRATLLKLTEAGKARADEIRAERESALAELFSKLTEEEKQTLSDLLDKLLS